MDVSIIILTKNAGKRFDTLLHSIFSQKFDPTYEVLVIDSGSIDETLTTARKFPTRITSIKPEEFHHGKTRNLGAVLSTGKILIYITQDALPLHDNWLQNLTGDFSNPDVAMIVGKQYPWQTTKPPEIFFYSHYFPDFMIIVNNLSADYRDNTFISNVNSAIRKDVWQQFKFSEHIILTEDKELAGKIISAGLCIVYKPDAAVYHAHDLGIRTVFWKSVDYGTSLRQGAVKSNKSSWSGIAKFMAYLGAEFKFLFRNGYVKWAPYCVIYESSRYLGTLLGKTGLVQSR